MEHISTTTRIRRNLVLALGLGAITLTSVSAAEVYNAKRIISVGGSITEIIYALGEQHRLIARDQTSTYPQEASALPDIGYIRALSPEGVLSTNPDLIVALEGYGPPEARQVIEVAGIPIVQIPEGFESGSILAKIRATAAAIGVPEKGEELVRKVAADLAVAEKAGESVDVPVKVLFVLSLQSGRIMAAGGQSHADGIITLAGGKNAISGFTGYKQITDEAVIEAAPDVILMMDRNDDHVTAVETLFSMPAIAATPAGQSHALVRMDGLYILGFGPRTADAARELGEKLASFATTGNN